MWCWRTSLQVKESMKEDQFGVSLRLGYLTKILFSMRFVLLCVPYQILKLVTMLLKPFLSCASRGISTVVIPAAIARLFGESCRCLPLLLHPSILPSRLSFSIKSSPTMCPTNISCLWWIVFSNFCSAPISRTSLFHYLSVHDIFFVRRYIHISMASSRLSSCLLKVNDSHPYFMMDQTNTSFSFLYQFPVCCWWVYLTFL